jgi:hypothetical protein
MNDPITSRKVTRTDITKRIKDHTQFEVIEPVTRDNLFKVQHSLKTLLKGGANVSLIIVPVAADPKQ